MATKLTDFKPLQEEVFRLMAKNKKLIEALQKADDILDGQNNKYYMDSFDRQQIKNALKQYTQK